VGKARGADQMKNEGYPRQPFLVHWSPFERTREKKKQRGRGGEEGGGPSGLGFWTLIVSDSIAAQGGWEKRSQSP